MCLGYIQLFVHQLCGVNCLGPANGDLVADGRGRDDKADADSQQNSDEASPGDESLGSEVEGVTSSSPLVGSVDGRVSVDVSTILVLEPVDTKALRGDSRRSER